MRPAGIERFNTLAQKGDLGLGIATAACVTAANAAILMMYDLPLTPLSILPSLVAIGGLIASRLRHGNALAAKLRDQALVLEVARQEKGAKTAEGERLVRKEKERLERIRACMSQCRALQAERKALKAERARRASDTEALDRYLPVLVGHLDSANACNEEGLVSIMGILHEVEAASAALLAHMGEGKERTESLERGQARSLEGCVQALREVSAIVEGKARDIADDSLRIQEHVGKLSNLTGIIRRISAQTNMLALNAAIEATRAGSSGQAFSVVVDEIRQLSRATREATEQIDAELASTSAAVERELRSVFERMSTEGEADQIRRLKAALEESLKTVLEVQRFMNGLADRARLDVGSIRDGILRSLGFMQFQDVSRQQVEAVKKMLGSIVGHMKSSSAEQAGNPPERNLEAVLESHRGDYVMQRQRASHDSAMGRGPTPEARPAIELF